MKRGREELIRSFLRLLVCTVFTGFAWSGFATDYGAECNPTGDPIGGGYGYSDVFSAADADYNVCTLAELTAAINSASSGDFIFIDAGAGLDLSNINVPSGVTLVYDASSGTELLDVLDDEYTGSKVNIVFVDGSYEIDLTGESSITIPGGITLASDRGYNGSSGALLYSDDYSNPIVCLFTTLGDNVRITGLRLRGPESVTGTRGSTIYYTKAIKTEHDTEIDNCEIYDWKHSAIMLDEDADTYIHHNYIHNNFSYGVCLGNTDPGGTIEALIEANLFSQNDHSIAGTGNRGLSYEARYNLVLENHSSHCFDMHGARDFEAHISVMHLRFDETEGSNAYDSSAYYSNSGTLTNMDTSSCWVTGQVNNGLEFDGIDDYVDCGSDASLDDMGDFSVFMWIYWDTSNNGATFAQKANASCGWFLEEDYSGANALQFRVVRSSTPYTRFEALGVLSSGWNHIGAVFHDSTGNVELYVNGSEVTSYYRSETGAGTKVSDASADLLLGKRYSDSNYFSGIMDEVKIYNCALTSDEVAVKYQYPDVAGDSIIIHHNTFRATHVPAVVIRGIPAVEAEIYNNWFYHDSTDPSVVKQINATGNMDVYDNYYGLTPPAGTSLPSAVANASPMLGSASLSVSFDGTGSSSGNPLISYLWKFGDGDEATGSTPSSHSYSQPGIYHAELMVIDDEGIPDRQAIPVCVTPGADDYILSFWVKDTYRGSLTNKYTLRALIDGTVVWSDDVAGDEGWNHVVVDVSNYVEDEESIVLAFEIYSANGVSSEDEISLSAYWDDVVLFGGKVENGDFEEFGNWKYTENSTGWSGDYQKFYSHEGGMQAFQIITPSSCASGDYARIEQNVKIIPDDVTGIWRIDEDFGSKLRDSSVYNNHASISGASKVQVDTSKELWVLSFDGTDDYVDAGSDSTLDDMTDFSVFTWIYWDTANNGATFVQKANSAGGWFLEEDQSGSNALQFRMVRSATPQARFEALNVLRAGWNYVGAVYHGSTDDVELYVNGSEVSSYYRSETGGGTRVSDASANLLFGKRYSDTNYFSGKMEETKIFACALTASEVMENYLAGNFQHCGRWKFDETEGSSATDTSGNGNDGTLTNMTTSTCWVDGANGNALEFNGSNAYIELGSSEVFDNLKNFSVFMWIYWDTSSNGATFMQKANSSSGWFFEEDDTDSNALQFRMIRATTSLRFEAVNVLHTGWNYIGAVYDDSSSTVKLYIDGSEVSSYYRSETGEGTRSSDATANLMIGKRYSNDHYFDGIMDEVCLHNRKLTDSEIYQNYQNQRPPCGKWYFDETSGSTAYDVSGNSNDGTLTYFDTGTCWVTGKINNGLDFDGTNDFVDCGSDASLDDMGDFSVFMWIYWDTSNNGATFAQKANASCGWFFEEDPSGSNALQFRVVRSSTPYTRFEALNVLSSGWNHIGAVFHDSTGNVELYVNGSEVTSYYRSETGAGTKVSDASASLLLGKRYSDSNYFSGIMDEVKIYDRALSADEISSLYEIENY